MRIRSNGKNRDSSSLALLGMTNGLAGGLRRGELRLYRAAACICLFLVLATALFARSWRVADFNATISVHADGSALVRERITLAFDGE